MYFKVIKSGTNRKLVYDFPLVVYITFAVSHTIFEKLDVKESNDLEICPRSADSIWVALQIFEQSCPSPKQILTQNGH